MELLGRFELPTSSLPKWRKPLQSQQIHNGGKSPLCGCQGHKRVSYAPQGMNNKNNSPEILGGPVMVGVAPIPPGWVML